MAKRHFAHYSLADNHIKYITHIATPNIITNCKSPFSNAFKAFSLSCNYTRIIKYPKWWNIKFQCRATLNTNCIMLLHTYNPHCVCCYLQTLPTHCLFALVPCSFSISLPFVDSVCVCIKRWLVFGYDVNSNRIQNDCVQKKNNLNCPLCNWN